MPCSAEIPLSPMAQLSPLGLLSLSRDHKPQQYCSPNAQCWLGLGVCSACTAHVFYIVCQGFTSLSASGLLPGLRELPASLSFTTAGDFPLRLCFDNLVKGLAFTKCFAVQTHPSLYQEFSIFPKWLCWLTGPITHCLCFRHPFGLPLTNILLTFHGLPLPLKCP